MPQNRTSARISINTSWFFPCLKDFSFTCLHRLDEMECILSKLHFWNLWLCRLRLFELKQRRRSYLKLSAKIIIVYTKTQKLRIRKSKFALHAVTGMKRLTTWPAPYFRLRSCCDSSEKKKSSLIEKKILQNKSILIFFYCGQA